ncbi:MAG: mandelate racemase/muconate lactonizing enzyme family protein [Proteobacteria bacterium]|nr:mandelate racemase/muconate lactonizing enzyme family protein [Pseudomonadota bacterium]
MADKVRTIEFHDLRHKLSRRYGDAMGLKSERRTVVVRVATEDGVVGWGEFYGQGVVPDQFRLAAELVEGASPVASNPVVDKLSVVNPRIAAGIEIALWDIRGKIAGLSMAELLGGPYRAAQPAYASLQNVSEAPDVAAAAVEEALTAIAKGYCAVKMKIGWHAPAIDLAWIERVLQALPADVLLAIDANRMLDLPVARHIAGAIRAPERIAWFEEPVSRAWPAPYRELRDSTAIAIAGGESMPIAMLEQVIATRAMDIINPDLVGHGGVGRMQHLFALCATQGVRLVPHVFDGQLARVATLHLLAAQPAWSERQSAFQAAPLECDISPNPLRDDLLEIALKPDAAGCIAVPTAPGLGITVNETILRTHAIKLAA